jgi:hypothetical protein
MAVVYRQRFAIRAAESAIEVARERESREHGPDCRCSLARAIREFDETSEMRKH